jgi:hypothetical protein
MNIIRSDKATQDDRVLTYKLTRSPEVQKLSTLSGQRIDVIHYCIYEDEKPDRKTGEIKATTIIALMTREGEIFASNSATVREEFLNMLDIFGEDLDKEGGYIPVKIIEGVSKNNRTFFTCTYAG